MTIVSRLSLKQAISLLVALALVFPTFTIALEEGGSTGGGSLGNEEAGSGEGEGEADSDGDGTSDAAEGEAAEAAAAEVGTAASVSGVDVSISAVDSVNNPNDPGGASVSVNGVSMSKEAALGAIGAMADAEVAGVAASANPDAPGYDTEATLAGYANGTLSDGSVVGNLTGTRGSPEAVGLAEIDAAIGRDTAAGTGGLSGVSGGNAGTAPSIDLSSAYGMLSTMGQAGILGIGGKPSIGITNTYSGPKGVGGLNEAALDAYSNTVTNNATRDETTNAIDVPAQTANQETVDARLAAAGFNPDGSVQRSVTIDYSNLMSVTTGRVADYQKNDTLDSKIAMEQNLIGMALNSNFDQASLGQVAPENIDKHGAIDNRDTNGAFAKSFDNTIAPGLWANSNLAGREQLGMSYMANVVGYTPNQAAYAIGNFKHESAGLDHLEEAAGTERSSGLAQWNASAAAGNRRGALEAFAGVKFSENLVNGRHTSGPGALTQLAFAAKEMKGTVPGHRDIYAERVETAFRENPNMTLEEGVRTFQNNFENPADKVGSLGDRISGAREALDAYYDINPEQKNFTENNSTDTTQPTTAPENDDDGGGRLPTVEVELGGIKIGIDPNKALDTARDAATRFFGGISGLFGNRNNGDTEYTSLPPTEAGEGLIVPELEQVVVTPGRPAVCQAGPDDQGFAFAVKLSNKDQYDRAHSCRGQTTGDYFILIAAYLRGYGINNIQEAEVLQKMQVINP